MITMPTVATVPVKPASESKINWTQFISTGAMIATVFLGPKFSLTPDQITGLAVGIGILADGVTWVLRTWFTKSVTPSSVQS